MFLFRSKYKDTHSTAPRKKRSRRGSVASLTIGPKPSTTALAIDVCTVEDSSDDSFEFFDDESEILYLIAEGRPFQLIEDSLSGFREHFKLRKKIGVGTFGKVVLSQRKCDGNKFAVKCIPKRRLLAMCRDTESRLLHIRALRNEVSVLRMASSHPNVASLYDVYEDSDYVFLVLEHCAGGELFDKLVADESLDEANAAAITKQLCAVLKFLHEKCGVVHCDLKPENILLADTHSLEIKLIDFGMAQVLEPGDFLWLPAGSPLYTAPEMIALEDIRPRYAHPCDLWSLGVIIFVMIFNFPPFAVDSDKCKGSMRQTNNAIYNKVLKGFTPKMLPVEEFGYGPWFPDSTPTTTAARDLMSRLLCMDSTKRMTAAQALDHVWLSDDRTDDAEVSTASDRWMAEDSSSVSLESP